MEEEEDNDEDNDEDKEDNEEEEDALFVGLSVTFFTPI